MHVVVGLDPQGRMYLLDLWRKQSASNKWIEAFCDPVEKWKRLAGPRRAGRSPRHRPAPREAHARAPRPCLPRAVRRAPRQGGAGAIDPRPHGAGRPVRAGRQPKASEATPFFERLWLADFRAELLAFPTGRHDDQVDALGLIGQLLDRMVPPAGPKQAGPRRDRWDRPDDDGGSWKTV